MTRLLTRAAIARDAIVHETVEEPLRAPAPLQPVTDRSFELPPVLYAATVACYLGFLAVMAAGLGNPGLAIPMAIFVLFVCAAFGLPAVWTRMQPDNPIRPMPWGLLVSRGIATQTGRVTARDAAVQMLILPVLIFLWGVTTVIVAAVVS